MKAKEILKNVPKITKAKPKHYGAFGLQLGKDLYDKFNEHCKENKIMKSKLIRFLIENYLNELEKESK